MDLRNSMQQLIIRYKLPIYVVETAHPWRHCQGEHVSEELMKSAGFPAGIEEQKKSLELVMQIAANVSGYNSTGVYYWEPLCIPSKTYGSWDENMGMLDEEGKVLESFEAYKNFDPAFPPIGSLNDYIEDLYKVDEENLMPAGTNLITNGDFSKGTEGWWVTKSSDDVVVEERDEEIYVSSNGNFTFDLYKNLQIDKAGKYQLSAEYRGTNTTGVEVELYLKTISCNSEELFSKTIYPSDVRFVTHVLDSLELSKGTVQLGIRMNTPPVFGRIKNIRLIEI